VLLLVCRLTREADYGAGPRPKAVPRQQERGPDEPLSGSGGHRRPGGPRTGPASLMEVSAAMAA